ncbi:hypothetical protein AB0L05_34270 [Nonomuraea pusilla]|uniref:hypothetical protein n=1 Tax=Nonomuraea pusilla TaxID=46177 RepID=UPI003321C31C
MRLLALLTAAVLPLTAAAPASAVPTIWNWRGGQSTDGKASAWGKVYIHQMGYLVEGNLKDTQGYGCSWVILKGQDTRSGRWKSHGFYNCIPGTGTFKKDYRNALNVKVQVCRGDADRPTGQCSAWKSIMRNGGPA